MNRMNNEQIMIVEDDNELNRGLCTAFRSEGRNVIYGNVRGTSIVDDLRTNE